MAERSELSQLVRQRVGAVLKDKWRLERLLGRGAMAAVYRATHRNGSEVAIKVLHPDLSLKQHFRERFLREGYLANKVKHHGAVTVYDDDVTDDGAAFLVMELLEGETLRARWKRNDKKLPAEEVLPLVDQLLDALAVAHEAGVVHRDLKPDNLFLTTEGVIKVLDFGIASLRELSSSDSSLTQTGALMGTPAYMPPEQARGRWNEVDARSDLWAVGAMMFALLTGDYVHRGGTVNEAVAMAITRHAPSLATVGPEQHPAVIQLVDRALAYEKDDRWQSARAMQAALRESYTALLEADIEDAPMSVPLVTADLLPSPTDSQASLEPEPAAVTTESGVSSSLEATPGGTAQSQASLATAMSTPRRGLLVVGALAAIAVGATVAVMRLTADNQEPTSVETQRFTSSAPAASPGLDIDTVSSTPAVSTSGPGSSASETGSSSVSNETASTAPTLPTAQRSRLPATTPTTWRKTRTTKTAPTTKSPKDVADRWD